MTLHWTAVSLTKLNPNMFGIGFSEKCQVVNGSDLAQFIEEGAPSVHMLTVAGRYVKNMGSR